MGAAPSLDEGLEDHLELPCDNEAFWSKVAGLLDEPAIDSVEELAKRIRSYRPTLHDQLGAGLDRALGPRGGEARQVFFETTLPFIVRLALQLPLMRKDFPGGQLPMLRQMQRAQVVLPRDLVACLLANMFLCTFPEERHEAMPGVSFENLLTNFVPQEVAKLQMFVHYFERLATDRLPAGVLRIDRMCGEALPQSDWLESDKPLLGMEMADFMVGFEEQPELAHADFANMFIGGGVLCGGCVQEEIRFSICPELCVSMLLCPCMREEEAIQLLGAEQFSAYAGYARGLQYAGDHQDQCERDADGSVKSSVLAMDALDLRGADSSLLGQLSSKSMCRELNKSLAAFTPVSEDALRDHRRVATGNWGCGAFGGCAPLKALIQWASASQCGRQLRYFPFQEVFGPELADFAAKAVEGGVTVGGLLGALDGIAEAMKSKGACVDGDSLLHAVRQRLSLQ